MERIKEAIAKASITSPAVPQRRDFDARQTETQKRSAAPQQDAVLRGVETILLDRASLKKHRIIAFDSRDPVCASFDMLRTRVAQVMNKHNWRTIAVTSPNPQAGKTTVAINLALSLARLHESMTVLVDFDLRNPNIGKFLNINRDNNIADLINRKINLSDSLIKIGIDNIYVLLNKNPILYSSELIGSRSALQFIENLKSSFSNAFIVFDLPPMLVTDDTLSLLPYIDCVLLVAAVHETRVSDLHESEQKLENANYLGVVLNKALEVSSGYKYN